MAGSALQLDPLDDHRNALPHSNTHRAQRITAASRGELIHRSGDDSRARHAERMADRNRATVRIDIFSIVRESELTHDREALRSKRLVELDDIHLLYVESRARQRLAARRHRSNSHDSRLD